MGFEEPKLPPRRQPTSGGGATVAPDPEVGDYIGSYELLEMLGKGGAGSVFKARRAEDGEIVALKVLSASKVKRARVVQRFFDEVRAASAVEHQGLVRVFDFIEEEHPRRLAYAMEYVEGEVLRARIKRDGALDLRQAIQIAIQICEALDALHEGGIIHRDLKPENILVISSPDSPMPKVKLFDFGVVKFLPVDRTTPSRNDDEKPGTFVGTPRYMAPEQAAGATVDGRADLYAVGVMLFEMITGRCPHEGDSLRDVVLAKLKGAPRITVNPEKEILPQELTEVVDACLQLKPVLRPKRAREVAAGLKNADLILFAVGRVLQQEPSRERRVPVVPASPERANPTPTVAPTPTPTMAPTPTPAVDPRSTMTPAPAVAEAPKSRALIYLLVAICIASAVALVVVWRVRQQVETPLQVIPTEPAKVITSSTSTTSS